MQRVEPQSIGDVLRQAIQSEGMTGRLDEMKAIALWPAIVGEDLAANMSRPEVNKGRMTIYVRSAALRQEMNMSRSLLIKLINEQLGKPVISDIRFR